MHVWRSGLSSGSEALSCPWEVRAPSSLGRGRKKSASPSMRTGIIFHGFPKMVRHMVSSREFLNRGRSKPGGNQSSHFPTMSQCTFRLLTVAWVPQSPSAFTDSVPISSLEAAVTNIRAPSTPEEGSIIYPFWLLGKLLATSSAESVYRGYTEDSVLFWGLVTSYWGRMTWVHRVTKSPHQVT
jgi:hypothetical protein